MINLKVMNNSQDRVKYKSKVDLFAPVGLGISLLISIAFSISAMTTSGIIAMTIGCVLFFVAFMYLINSTSYTVDNDTKRLVIKSAFTYQDYNVLKIKIIKRSSSILSNTKSSSLDRIALKFPKEEVIISPKDKHAFIAHIQQLHPEVRIEIKKKKYQKLAGSSN